MPQQSRFGEGAIALRQAGDEPTPVSRPPNILWILTTQWRAQATGYSGDANARTPNLDALAAQSVNYAQAVTPHPFGPFARAALLTGVASPANGVCEYFDPLPSNARTVAHALNDRGYLTSFFGKWHLGERDPAAALVGEVHARTVVPADQRGGFLYWEGFESGFLLNNPWLHGTTQPEPIRVAGYQSEVLVDRFLSWQATPAGSGTTPWFALVSMEAPHPPYDAPASGVLAPLAASLHLDANVPRGGEIDARARRELAGYYAHIEATDRAIGRLLSNLAMDTIVVFTSVHGDMHGAHGLFRKGWPYEESIRVPFLVRSAPHTGFAVKSPGPATQGDGAGHTSLAPVSLLDLPAMTLAWAQGLAWTCAHGEAEISMPCVVALPHQCDRRWHGRRSPTRKTILNCDGTPWLEFDLLEDPLELRNLADER